MEIPNLEMIREITDKLNTEYDLQTRLNRYKTLPDLLNLTKKNNLTDEDAAIRALFIADFIVTTSELPPGNSDEDRYQSVIQSFKVGTELNSTADNLMRIFYLAYKIVTLIRRQDLFMGGRGLDRKSSLLRIKDTYFLPYLKISTQMLKQESSCMLQLGILAAALLRDFPDKQIQKYRSSPPVSNIKELIPVLWKLLLDYAQKQSVDTNPNAVIPNLEKSQSILMLDAAEKGNFISLWNVDPPSNFTSLKVEIQSMDSQLNKLFDNKSLISLRCQIQDAEDLDHIFIVRDPNIISHPILVLATPADEINLNCVKRILHLRGLEGEGWKPVIMDTAQETKNIEPISSGPLVKPEITPKAGKGGLLNRIKNLFKKKSVEEGPALESSIKPIQKKKWKDIPAFVLGSEFLAKSLTVEAVGDFALFEEFDTIREANYSIIGVLESELETKKTQIMIKKVNQNLSEVYQFYEGILSKLNKLSQFLFNIQGNLVIDEVFWMNEHDEKFLLCVDQGNSRLVGTLAASYRDKIADLQIRASSKEELQRRSIHMRNKQFLGALGARTNPDLRETIDRIFGQNFDCSKAVLLEF
ncbi:hypothetical protein [Candidatus Hodarchaeum mangrovi]